MIQTTDPMAVPPAIPGNQVNDYEMARPPFKPPNQDGGWAYGFIGDFTHLQLINRIEGEMTSRNLSEEKMEAYRQYIEDFMIFVGRDPENMTISDIEEYIEDTMLRSRDREIARASLRMLFRAILRRSS